MQRTKLTIFLFSFALILSSQNLVKSNFSKYPFIKLNADTVSNHVILQPFFQKLIDLKSGKSDSKVNIVHMGDSHIQGDFQTSVIRTLVQKEFGNGGRGFVFPHRLVNLYEARDIVSASENNWDQSVISSSKKVFEPGLAGFSISTNDSLKIIDLTTLDHDSLSYAFSKLTVVCRNHSTASLLLLRDTLSNINKLTLVENDFLQVVELDTSTNHIQLMTEGAIYLDGFILENNQPGILYHVLGVHGAHFVEFVNAPLFFEQLPALHPDIILVSLGTNDGVNRRITYADIREVIEKLVEKIEKYNPQAQVVLLTPFDNYYRRRTNNKYLQIVQKAIVEVAEEKNLAYIDAYQITGGYGSALQWRKYGFLRSDGIHYTKAAYELQAKIIYQALINSYLKYANN